MRSVSGLRSADRLAALRRSVQRFVVACGVGARSPLRGGRPIAARRATVAAATGLLTLLAWLVGGSALAAGGEARFALVVGSNRGAAGSPDLQYAQDDAGLIHRVLGELGGVPDTARVLLADPDLDTFRHALAALERRIEAANSEGRTTQLVLYYSGHATTRGLELGDGLLSLEELKGALRSSHAALRIAVIDACYSGAILRIKGSTPAEAFPLALDDNLQDRGRGVSGYAILTSSSAHEVSQETDLLGGSVFTHYVVAGLRGDADYTGDRRVTLGELTTYAHERSVPGDAGWPQQQHPTVDLGLSGSGDPVLTDLTFADASLVLPADLEGGVVVVHRGGDYLLADITKRAGLARTLAVEPGALDVYVRDAGGVRVASLELAKGETRDAGTLTFAAAPQVAVRHKSRHGELAVGLGVQGFAYLSPTTRSALVRPLAALELGVEWHPWLDRAWYLLSRVSGGYAGQTVQHGALAVDQNLALLGGLAGGGYDWWWRAFRVSPWAAAGVMWVDRRFSAVNDRVPGAQTSVQALFEGGLTLGWAPVRFGSLSLVGALGYTPFRSDVTSVHQAYTRFGLRADVWF